MDGRPPEARIIRDRREQQGLSIREAARRAAASGKPMSEGSWRRTEGPRKLTRTAETLARMAQVVGVTPAELEARGRPDAARALAALAPLPEPQQDIQEGVDELRRRLAQLEALAADRSWPQSEGSPLSEIREAHG